MGRYATVYNDFFLPNNLHNDTDFLTHDLVHRSSWVIFDPSEAFTLQYIALHCGAL